MQAVAEERAEGAPGRFPGEAAALFLLAQKAEGGAKLILREYGVVARIMFAELAPGAACPAAGLAKAERTRPWWWAVIPAAGCHLPRFKLDKGRVICDGRERNPSQRWRVCPWVRAKRAPPKQIDQEPLNQCTIFAQPAVASSAAERLGSTRALQRTADPPWVRHVWTT